MITTVSVHWPVTEKQKERVALIPAKLRKWFDAPKLTCENCMASPPRQLDFIVLPGGGMYCSECVRKALKANPEEGGA